MNCKRLVTYFAWLVAGFCPGIGHAEELPSKSPALSVPPGITYLADVPYGKSEQMFDIAMPAKGDRLPTVVVLHGTGPLAKGRKRQVPLILDLAEKGFVAVAVGFRHKPTDVFPAPCHDVKCAVRSLRACADKYHIDPDHIGVVGFSGGGTLACLLGLATPADNLDGDGDFLKHSSAVQAVVSYFAPTDFQRLHAEYAVRIKKGKGNLFDLEGAKAAVLANLVETWLKGPPLNNPLYKLASPLTYLRKSAPPFLILHGSADAVIPPKHSEDLAKALQAAGARAELRIFPGAEHDFDGEGDANARAAAQATANFLEEHLKTPRRPAKTP